MGGIIVIDFIDLMTPENRKTLFDHFKNEMESDRAKHKILPPSKIGLIQMTRQRVRSEMEIKTIEANPNQNGTVEAPIVLIDKIYDKIEKVFSTKKYDNIKVFLHVHPFVAAYLKSEYPSIRMKWYLKHKRWVTIVPRDAYTYLHFRFFSKEGKIINA
jgi:ribonuclease G